MIVRPEDWIRTQLVHLKKAHDLLSPEVCLGCEAFHDIEVALTGLVQQRDAASTIVESSADALFEAERLRFERDEWKERALQYRTAKLAYKRHFLEKARALRELEKELRRVTRLGG